MPARLPPPGLSCGPSGLSPSILHSLVAAPGSALCAPLVDFIAEVFSGSAPDDIAPLLSGAKLIALKKKDGTLRPIACSEVIRRIAAKILAGRLAGDLRMTLTPSGQMGVAVPWARQVAPQLEADEVICNVDFKNAFNSIFRAAILGAALKYAPELDNYVVSRRTRPPRASSRRCTAPRPLQTYATHCAAAAGTSTMGSSSARHPTSRPPSSGSATGALRSGSS